MTAKRLNRRGFLGMCAAVAGTAALAGCAQQTPTPVVVKETVVVAGTPKLVEKVVTVTPAPRKPVTVKVAVYTSPEYQEAVNMVKAANPLINVEVSQTPATNWAIYADNVITRIAGGEGIDVIQIAIEGTALFASKNLLLPLDPFLQADGPAKKDIEEDIHPGLLKMLQWKGQQMLLPFGWNVIMIAYNLKRFEEKGVKKPTKDWTWDDFQAACLALAEIKGGDKDVLAYAFLDKMFMMHSWYFNNDTAILTEGWVDSNLNDPKVAETLQFLADLILKHKVVPNPMGFTTARASFYARHVAMLAGSFWLVKQGRDDKFYDYALAYPPHKQGPYKAVVGVDGFGIATMSAHREESWEVIKVFTGREHCRRYINLMVNVPSRRSVANSAAFLDCAKPAPADLGMYFAVLDQAAVVPSPTNFNLIEPLVRRMYSSIWNGELPVKQALAETHKLLQAEMDKLKK